jgi:methyl coenzyme M reductase subunit C
MQRYDLEDVGMVGVHTRVTCDCDEERLGSGDVSDIIRMVCWGQWLTSGVHVMLRLDGDNMYTR